MDEKEILSYLADISYNAGRRILEVYNSEFAVENKEDSSPLTLADKESHKIIDEGLKKFDFPVLSEEGREINYEERSVWKKFWMVDPLDGTKEFVNRNGEFTVNIALIEDGQSILGLIYVPAEDVLYFGTKSLGAFKIEGLSEQLTNDPSKLFSVSNRIPKNEDRAYTVVGSRSHMSDETLVFMESIRKEHPNVEILSKGSSLKLCLLAEGKADIYPRFAPTMEWDIAAGQAILEASGGEVIDWETKNRMLYNKENLRNNWFLAKA